MRLNSFYKFTLIILTLSLITSCVKSSHEKPIITVSIIPQKYFADKIVGNKMKIVCMVPAGSNPEAYDPSPNQLIHLNNSLAYIAIGNLGFELAWLGKLVQNQPKLKIFYCSDSINLIESQCKKDHDRESDHSHIGQDPHIWSSPKSARIMAYNIFKAISLVDTVNTKFYKKNLIKLLQEIDSTDYLITEQLKNLKTRSFLIYHPALTYLARDYQLNQFSVEFNGKEPTPQHIKNLIEIAHKQNIKAIFVQKEFDIKNASILSKETRCRIVSIDPLNYEWSKGLMKITNALTNE